MLSLSGWRRRNSIKLSRRQNTASRHMLVLFRSNLINLVLVCRSIYCYYANTLKIRIALFLYILLAIQHRSNIGISFLMANLVRSKLKIDFFCLLFLWNSLTTTLKLHYTKLKSVSNHWWNFHINPFREDRRGLQADWKCQVLLKEKLFWDTVSILKEFTETH